MSLRIAFTGASGTGKSTLAAYLAEVYNLPQNPIGSRSVSQAMGFASPYDVDVAGKRAEFQRRLFADKVAWEAENEQFVTDRTPLDNLLYTMLHEVAIVDEAMLETVRVGLARYTHVIYCPVSAFCQVGEDPARVQSMTYQTVYDAALSGLLMKYFGWPRWEGGLISLYVMGLEERKKMVRQFIEGWRP